MGTSNGRAHSTLSLYLGNEASIEMLRLVLDFEAARIGVGRLQACYDLVMGGIDAGDYPDEVLGDLDMLRGKRRRSAINACGRAAEAGMLA